MAWPSFRASPERGASIIEYALLLSLFALAAIPAIESLQGSAATYLADTAGPIGADRAGTPTTVAVTTPDPPAWVAVTPTYGPELISNGGFESPTTGSWMMATTPGWTSDIPSNEAWATASGQLELQHQNHKSITPVDGVQYAELNANRPSAYSQTVTVTPGAAYRWVVNHRARSTAGDQAQVIINGQVMQTMTGQLYWQTYEGTTVAQSSSITITLNGTVHAGPANVGNLIDAVSIREIQF